MDYPNTTEAQYLNVYAGEIKAETLRKCFVGLITMQELIIEVRTVFSKPIATGVSWCNGTTERQKSRKAERNPN